MWPAVPTPPQPGSQSQPVFAYPASSKFPIFSPIVDFLPCIARVIPCSVVKELFSLEDLFLSFSFQNHASRKKNLPTLLFLRSRLSHFSVARSLLMSILVTLANAAAAYQAQPILLSQFDSLSASRSHLLPHSPLRLTVLRKFLHNPQLITIHRLP